MPLPKGNNKTDKVRAYQNQFAKERYKTAACKISIEKYDRFQAYAISQGENVSSLLIRFINSCIDADPGNDPGQPE